jgi:hypothetical protein
MQSMSGILHSKIRHRKNAALVLALIISALFLIYTLPQGNCNALDWMDGRIQTDLQAFETISTKELDIMEESFLENNFPFMRLKISNGDLTFTHPEMRPAFIIRIEGYVRYLKKMQLTQPLPDTDLLIFLEDGLDESILNNINAPIFCGAKSKFQSKVLVLPELFLYPKLYEAGVKAGNPRSHVPWGDKIGIGYWRGSTTGGWYTPETCMHTLRTKFVQFSKNVPTLLDCSFTHFCQGIPEAEKVMRKKGLFKEPVKPEAQLKYKYLIAIDGNTCASSLKWQLFTNSVVLKNDSDWMEWYDTALIPYKHYVPFRTDFSDLPEKIEWLKKHDAEARQIASAGRIFAQKNLTEEALETYVRKLLAAYSSRLRP